MFEILRYTPSHADEWNQFVATSKNGTFLFDRRYMDYHADRFEDCSLMFFLNGKLYGLLPANRRGDVLYSHQGLTYGGLIMNEKATASAVLQLFREMNGWLLSQGIAKVIYKAVPHIYHTIPAEEDLFALYSACDAQLLERNVTCSIDLSRKLKWNRDRKYGINRCRNNGVVVKESEDLDGFWEILNRNLMQRFGAKPIHTIEEMRLLKSRFPRLIRLFVAEQEGRMLGGTLLYLSRNVVHTQYISASEEGKHLRVMDAIFHHLLNEREWGCRYFDFGTSNEEDGRYLKESLIYQKEGFGARAVSHDIYEYDVREFREFKEMKDEKERQ